MSSQKRTEPIESQKMLKQGSKGSRVTQLQNYLERYGYLKPDALHAFNIPEELTISNQFHEGDFDDDTRQAVAAFQEKLGLEITGEADLPTLKLMEIPRCGVPDTGKFAIDGRKWDKLDLTYGFQEYTPDMSSNDVRNAIRQALSLWSDVTPLQFSERPVENGPDIVIRFTSADHGDGIPFDGPGGTFGHAFYPPPNGGSLAGDAHFDDDENWTITPTPESIHWTL